jgi:hypothetical protein
MSGLALNHNHAIGVSRDEFREGIKDLESQLRALDDSVKISPPVEHFFADGMYGRKMTIDKDVVIIGKIHKHSHLNVISEGVIDVITEFGTARYVAPITFVSNAMTKRMVRAVERTVWTTCHATNETDLDKIEDELIAKEYVETLGGEV